MRSGWTGCAQCAPGWDAGGQSAAGDSGLSGIMAAVLFGETLHGGAAADGDGDDRLGLHSTLSLCASTDPCHALLRPPVLQRRAGRSGQAISMPAPKTCSQQACCVMRAFSIQAAPGFSRKHHSALQAAPQSSRPHAPDLLLIRTWPERDQAMA